MKERIKANMKIKIKVKIFKDKDDGKFEHTLGTFGHR